MSCFVVVSMWRDDTYITITYFNMECIPVMNDTLHETSYDYFSRLKYNLMTVMFITIQSM